MDLSTLVVGDKSDHGGVIITGDPLMTVNGKPIARIGDLHSCPKFYETIPPIPHGVTPIIATQNVPNRAIVNNRLVAVEGDMCVCGCKLFSQSSLMKCVGLGISAVSVFAIGAAFLLSKNSSSKSSLNTSNNLTKEQNAMISNKVYSYEAFIKKFMPDKAAQVTKNSPPSTNENCKCE